MPRRKIDLSTSGEGRVIDMKTGKPVEVPVLPVICERVKHYREQQGIEQKELAKHLGITANSISNWENGRSRPDVNLLPSLCDSLGITFYDLFNMKDPTMRYTAGEQQLIEKYDRLSAGHKRAVVNLIDTLDMVEAAENCPDIKPLTCLKSQSSARSNEPYDDGKNVYVYFSPAVEAADCIFTVCDESMEPMFHTGQDLLIQRIPNAPNLKDGEIGAFAVEGEVRIRRFQEDGLYSSYETLRFKDTESVYLIGRVLGVLDKEQYATASDIQKYLMVHEEERNHDLHLR